MDDTNKDFNTTEWVHDSLAGLAPAPGWQPNYDRGLAHLHWYERMAKRRQCLQRATVLAVLMACIAVLSVPTARVIAGQLLNRFYMRNPEAVRSTITRAERSMLRIEYTFSPAMGHVTPSLAEAQREAGFALRLPSTLIEQVASGLAVLMVIGQIDVRTRINVEDLRAALRRRRIDGVDVPQNWDGIEIGYHVDRSAVVVSLDGTFEQSLPPVLLAPTDFPLIDFTETALRIAGVNPLDAHASRAMFVESRGAFAIVPADAKSIFREVSLKFGQGLLFENDTDLDERQKCSFCPGPHERILTWAALGRLFQLRSQTMTVEQAVELANSIN
jgi:hypothetical protein